MQHHRAAHRATHRQESARSRILWGLLSRTVLDLLCPLTLTPLLTYQSLSGTVHDMWDRIEMQPKGPHRVLVLRAQRKPEWANAE